MEANGQAVMLTGIIRLVVEVRAGTRYDVAVEDMRIPEEGIEGERRSPRVAQQCPVTGISPILRLDYRK